MKKRKKVKRKKGRRKGPREDIREELRRACTAVVGLTDAFCEKYLNEDYRELCREMADVLYQSGFPFDKGRPSSWAGGIVHTIGFVNFLQDPQQSPHMTSAQIADGFGISQGTMTAKSKIIRDELDVIQLDPDWCTPAMLENNPLVWMLKVNGFIMDIRLAPRDAQEEAYRLGLIPFIPADRQEPQSDTQTKIIKFPSVQNETAGPKSTQKLKDDGPSLFEMLAEQGTANAEQ